MRTLTLSGVLVAAAACSLVFAPSALATKGDNGTVKIHDASTGEELLKNEPHVCTFYLDAFGFDDGQEVDWRIEAWAPTAGVKGETVKTGSLTLDGSGHGRTEDLSLPDGHYKLFWNFDGENGRAKQKVFWTDCEAVEGDGDGKPGTSGPGERPSAETSDETSTEVSDEASAGASGSAAGGESSASAVPVTDGSGGGDLAETGSSAPVGVLAGVAAALVAGGGYLVARRRRTQVEAQAPASAETL
ncbi:LAETG motif-containing sortase-dependent surface protein [Streptomyces sp. NPDC093546]|uniref:LAETG motif-containing sortase-dependent surface protein n=1 Tax=Streptomyces sp. NPDC093546 TaxID=3366040 RepID=UPI00381D6F74